MRGPRTLISLFSLSLFLSSSERSEPIKNFHKSRELRNESLKQLLWLIALICSFLSLWIVLPGSNLFFLRLAVAAPEISPFLDLISGTALFFVLLSSLISDCGDSDRKKRLSLLSFDSNVVKGLILLLLVTVSLCALPSLQRPSAIAAANQWLMPLVNRSR